jgi:hypothetical protein
MHKFTVLIDGSLRTFSKFEDIPENFDNIIEFLPHIPDPPHSEDQHKEIEQWNSRLQLLIAKENQKNGIS